MDLTARLLRAGARRPHVLVVPVPGATGARLAVEQTVARHGWPAAASPADTDLLVVAGAAGPALAGVVDDVWAQVPAPRARTSVTDPAAVGGRLDRAARSLADVDHQRRTAPRSPPPAGSDHGDGHPADGGMEAPAGLPMADVGADRDGLALDRLHVALGPVLPDWPPGLVLRTVLQGDVVQEATAEVLDAGADDGFWTPERAAARELDGLARFLGVAGWAHAAARARGLRDGLLAGRPVADDVRALLRRVAGSRTLRRMVCGIPGGAGDVADLLDARLAAVAQGLDTAAVAAGRQQAGELAGLVVGAELAVARLVVAAADPDTAPAAGAAEAGSGEDSGHAEGTGHARDAGHG